MKISINNSFKSLYKKALVTGGAGFIGSHLVDALLELGVEVTVIDNLSAGKLENLQHHQGDERLLVVNVDISSIDEIEPYFIGVDVVFHNAASKKNICLFNPARDLDVNARSALNIMLLAQKYGIKKVVHASTGSVYGEPESFPVTEEHKLNPTSYYGVSKLAGERYVDVFNKLYDINTTILRYFHVYGPRQESDPSLGGVVAIFIKNIINGRSIDIHGDGNQIRSFTYVEDVVAANLLVAVSDESKGQVYNVASGLKITINDLVGMLKKRFNGKMNGEISINYTSSLIGDIKYFDIDNNKLVNLGVLFTDFDRGLKNTVQHFTHEG